MFEGNSNVGHKRTRSTRCITPGGAARGVVDALQEHVFNEDCSTLVGWMCWKHVLLRCTSSHRVFWISFVYTVCLSMFSWFGAADPVEKRNGNGPALLATGFFNI